MKVKDILQKFDELVPVAYSLDAKKNLGFYDNSGMILDCATDTDCVVCALDLCDDVVDYAIKVGAKLIITHHPAIYKGITMVDGTYVKAIANGITVYSAHLNFDVAVDGIDDRLAKMAGANQTQTLMYVNESRGFGRRFCIEPQIAESVVNALIAQLIMQIQAVKGVYFGENPFEFNGFGTSYVGEIKNANGIEIANSKTGGIDGGMTNGDFIKITVGVKPIPTTVKGVKSVDLQTNEETLSAKQRADTTAVFAICPILKSVVALALCEAVTERLGCDNMQEIIKRYNAL